MRTAPVYGLIFGAVVVLAGCGDSEPSDASTGSGAGGTAGAGGGSGGEGGGAGGGGGGSGGSGGGSSAEWTALIKADWQLAPGTEKTADNHFVTIEKDTYIGAIRPIAPTGTHHTVLGKGGFSGSVIYASGVGTNPLVFPKGVGLKLAAGQTLALQLHLFNPSFETISGTSGIEIIEIDPADVEQEADIFLPGPLDFSIPPNQKYTATGTCTANAKQNIFAIFPHMHQLGTHFKTTVNVGGVDKVIHDGDYDFNHQAFIPFEAITLEPGDSVKTECTWQNTGANTVGWGESSTTEMCFSILYRYPAQPGGGVGFCTD